MSGAAEYLRLDDDALLAQCDVHAYKSSGPGGQHRNKVSSAVRLRHRPTGLTVHGDDSRSQHDNRRLADRRLRLELACRLRGELDAPAEPPPALTECLFAPRGGQSGAAAKRLAIGRKDGRFWTVAAVLLDALEAFEGRLADAAAWIGISSSNLTSVLESDRHLMAAAQAIRRRHGHKPLQ